MNNINLIKTPDNLQAETEKRWVSLNQKGEIWKANGITVTTPLRGGTVKVLFHSPKSTIKRLLYSWSTELIQGTRILGRDVF
jgi:hypothetical protein